MSFTNEQEKIFSDILQVLNVSGGLEDVILIGSWAEYLYEKINILQGFCSLAKTTDIDFLIKQSNGKDEKNIINKSKEAGFVYSEDYLNGISKFTKDNFEVEFLICQKGDGTKKPPRTNLGVNAEPLTHLSILEEYCMPVEYQGCVINIPIPESYIIQKMIVNNRRGNKSLMDREKINSLLPYIDKEKFEEVCDSLSKKEKKIVNTYLENYPMPDTTKDADIILSYKKEQEEEMER